MEVIIGGTYKHFKGTLYKVLMVAKHSETLEKMVVYTHEGSDDVWVRPYDLFTSKVDYQKYPDVTQEYRFEYQESL